MKRSGIADVPLYSGPIPAWLGDRMTELSGAITEAIVQEYGTDAFLQRLADPFWFQSFGAVLGMDWNSSGVTTAVMAALKRSINPRSKELGLYVCGGKGKASLQTPNELLVVGEKTGLNGQALAYCSRLSAKVDNTAVQDGFQIYLHSFVVNQYGNWSVVQQGMNTAGELATARRYHWHSANVKSFVEEPHSAVCGLSQGEILNLVAREAMPSKLAMMQIVGEHPDKIIPEIKHLVMPAHKEVRAENVDMKRLGAMLYVTHEQQPKDFEELLMTPGMGPRTLQSLALVSEVIHGTPSRFSDPARFSFAHGGKGRHPYAVPTKVYDETINSLRTAVDRAKLGQTDRQRAYQRLVHLTQAAEKSFIPHEDAKASLDNLVKKEKEQSWQYGGMSIHGPELPPLPSTED